MLLNLQMSPAGEDRSIVAEAQSKSDLIMMCMLKGKERDRSQWETLFASSGFCLQTIIQTRTPFRIIVAKPAPHAFCFKN